MDVCKRGKVWEAEVKDGFVRLAMVPTKDLEN